MRFLGPLFEPNKLLFDHNYELRKMLLFIETLHHAPVNCILTFLPKHYLAFPVDVTLHILTTVCTDYTQFFQHKFIQKPSSFRIFQTDETTK